MLRYIYLLAIFFLLGSASSFSQVYQAIEWYDVDSLKSVLPDQEGKERANTLYRLAASLCFEDFNETIQYANDALILSEKLNYREGVAAATRYLGNAYYYKGDYPKTLEFVRKSLNVYKELNNKPLIAKLLLDICVTHAAAKNYDKALELVQECMEAFRNLDHNGSKVSTVRDTLVVYSTMAMILRLTGRADSALNIYALYLDVGKKTNLEPTNMMVHLGNAADCSIRLGEFEGALSFFREALTYPELNPSIRILKKEFKRRIGMVYLLEGRIDSALVYLTEAFESLSREGYLMQSQQASQYLGEIYYKLNQIDNAEFYFRNSEELLNEMILKKSWYRHDSLKYTVSFGWEIFAPLSKKYIKEFIYNSAVKFYSKMYRYSKERGLTEPYIRYIEAYTLARDTLVEIERKRELIEIQTKFESEQKDSEIQSLSQENELKEFQIKQTRFILFGLGGVLLLGVAFVILFMRQKKLKEEQEKSNLQNKLLRTQMNPHFIFNSLSSIQHLVVNEDSEKASIYLAKFSTLVRSVLYSSANDTITIDNEIKTIESYLALQEIRYSNKFEYTVDVDPQIDTESLTIPPMLAQPFIENAIEHGIKHKKGKGQIYIRFKLIDLSIHIEVEDDGVGRQKAQELEKEFMKDHQSMATEITRDRIRVLNKKKKNKIQFNIIDLKNDNGKLSGTLVKIDIPLEDL